MKQEFQEYLKSIGLTQTAIQKIETLYEYAKEICPDEIQDMFVTDYFQEDGSRMYESHDLEMLLSIRIDKGNREVRPRNITRPGCRKGKVPDWHQ